MKKTLTGMLTIAGLCSAASAQGVVAIQVCPAGSQAWSSTLPNVQPGSAFDVRFVAAYNGQGFPLGLASLTLQPTVSSWDNTGTAPATDALAPLVNGGAGGNRSTPLGVVEDLPNLYGRISPWGRALLTTTSFLRGHTHLNPAPMLPGTYLRIAQNHATSWIGGPGNTAGVFGIPIAQINDSGRLASDPAFNSQTSNLVLFKFKVTLSTDPAPRTLSIDAPIDGFGNRNGSTGIPEIYWYSTMSEPVGTIRGGPPVIIPASVHVNACTATRPADTSVLAGDTVKVKVVTSSVAGGSPTFQWRRNGVNLVNDARTSGATASSLRISPAATSDAGLYDVVMNFQSCGQLISQPATVSVACGTLNILSQPRDAEVSHCQGATFSVVSGSDPSTYRWRRNGINLDNSLEYSGVTTPTLTVTPEGIALGGQFDVVVTSACGVATSHSAKLFIRNPADFNGDGDVGTDADLEDFFACLGGNCCATCLTADLDGDGDTGTDLDIQAIFRAVGGGPCL